MGDRATFMAHDTPGDRLNFVIYRGYAENAVLKGSRLAGAAKETVRLLRPGGEFFLFLPKGSPLPAFIEANFDLSERTEHEATGVVAFRLVVKKEEKKPPKLRRRRKAP